MVLELVPKTEGVKCEFKDKVKFDHSQINVAAHPPLEYGDDDANQLQYLQMYKHRLNLLKPRLLRLLKMTITLYVQIYFG